MTTILSLSAVGRLAQRRCRELRRPVPLDDLVTWLQSLGVDIDRAHAGIRLALIVQRLEETADAEGRPCLRVPAKAAA